MTAALIGVVTVSDRASAGEYDDRGGPAVVAYLSEVLTSEFRPVRRLVPDDQAAIEAALRDLVDQGCALIVTTGGTGPSPRDVTPEATLQVADRVLPGFGEEMRRVSIAKVPTAALSRQVAAIAGRSLIINLPGSPKAVAECLDAVMAAVPDCVDQIGGPRLETNPERIAAHRPHH